MRRNQRFLLLPQHVLLLRSSYVSEEITDVEYGAAEIDPKRPYGNSAVEQDLALLLGFDWDEDEYTFASAADAEVARRLHRETPTALQIVLTTGSFEPGIYEASLYGSDWRRVGDLA